MDNPIETNRNYEEIERPYNAFLERSDQTVNQDSINDSTNSGATPSSITTNSQSGANGNVENQSVKTDGAIGDVWIRNFIRSENWKPKKVGFYINGLTGYAEFSNVYVSGNIKALSGTIGGFTIGSTNLSATSGGNTTTLSSGAIAFSSGPTGAPTVTITQSGLLTATAGYIGGWEILSTLLRSDTSGTRRIELNKGDNRISIFDAVNEKVVMGYLNGLSKHDGSGNWGPSDYGFWARTGDSLSIDGAGEFTSGDWLIQNDASYLVKDSSNNTIIRLGTDSGEKGLFIYNTSGTQLSKFISTAAYIGSPSSYLQYTVAGGLSIYANISDAITLDYGSNVLLKSGGNLQFTSVDETTSCTATLVATATGNVPNGSYWYATTFVTATGESGAGVILSNFSNNVTVDASHKQVDLTNIPISSSGAVTARNIYRIHILGGQPLFCYIDTISDNVTTIYTDNLALNAGTFLGGKQNDTFGKVKIDGIESLSLGGSNTYVGQHAANGFQYAAQTTAIGAFSLFSNVGGTQNTAVGASSMYANVSGQRNVSIGANSLSSNVDGDFNVAIGYDALWQSNLTAVNEASYNVAVGYLAGYAQTTGSSNTFVGYNADGGATDQNCTALGSGATCTKSHQMVFGNTNIVENLFHGSVKIGGTVDRGTTVGTNVLHIFNGTAPVGTLTNGCSFYSTTGEMRVMDAAGNATLLSPHDKETNEWIFDSLDTVTGKRVKIDMEKMLRKLNEKFGWDFVHDLIG